MRGQYSGEESCQGTEKPDDRRGGTHVAPPTQPAASRRQVPPRTSYRSLLCGLRILETQAHHRSGWRPASHKRKSRQQAYGLSRFERIHSAPLLEPRRVDRFRCGLGEDPCLFGGGCTLTLTLSLETTVPRCASLEGEGTPRGPGERGDATEPRDHYAEVRDPRGRGDAKRPRRERGRQEVPAGRGNAKRSPQERENDAGPRKGRENGQRPNGFLLPRRGRRSG